MTNIWEALNINDLINVVEHTVEKKLSNLCLQRNSYINRVFELEYADTRERIIVKFYRPGRWTKPMIEEEHLFVRELALAETPVISPLEINGKTLHEFSGIPFAVYPKKGGRALDEFDKEGWLQIGRLLSRLHVIGEKRTDSQRVIWTPDHATKAHCNILQAGKYIPAEYEKAFLKVSIEIINKALPHFKQEQLILLHGDCHKGNLIHRPGEGIFIVDFDDICVGPEIQDIWMLLPDHVHKSEQELQWFIEGYETFRSFPERSLRLAPALRAMRIIHFAAWCAMQSKDLDFYTHFPEWGSPRYWNELIRELQAISQEEL